MARFRFSCSFVIEGSDEDIKSVALRNAPTPIGGEAAAADSAALIIADLETAIATLGIDVVLGGQWPQQLSERLAPLTVHLDLPGGRPEVARLD